MVEGKGERPREGKGEQRVPLRAKTVEGLRFDLFPAVGRRDELERPILGITRGEERFDVHAIQREGASEIDPEQVPPEVASDLVDTSFYVYGKEGEKPVAGITGGLIDRDNRIFYVTDLNNFTRPYDEEDELPPDTVPVPGIVGDTAAGLVQGRVVDVWYSSQDDERGLLTDSAKGMYRRLDEQSSEKGLSVTQTEDNRFEIRRQED